MSKAEEATKLMEQIANDDSHGYDQTNRWGTDYDCSSLVITCWENVGVKVKTAGATYTGNMYNVFIKCGFKDVTTKVNLINADGLQRGDVLLNKKHHVAMYCGNNKEVEASINEKGTAKGGKTGDQTGKEILIRAYRNYPWDCVLRYTDSTGTAVSTSDSLMQVAKDVIAGKYGNGDVRKRRLENAGYNYLEVQKCVNKLLKQ
jgi:hypothetical protein